MDGSCKVYSNTDKKALKDKVKSFITIIGSGKTLQIFCNVCNKSWTRHSHEHEHVEIHIEGLHFYCTDCDFTATSRHGLRGHKKRLKLKAFERNMISTIDYDSTEEMIIVNEQFRDNDMFNVLYQ